jgi:hypothetical protein
LHRSVEERVIADRPPARAFGDAQRERPSLAPRLPLPSSLHAVTDPARLLHYAARYHEAVGRPMPAVRAQRDLATGDIVLYALQVSPRVVGAELAELALRGSIAIGAGVAALLRSIGAEREAPARHGCRLFRRAKRPDRLPLRS